MSQYAMPKRGGIPVMVRSKLSPSFTTPMAAQSVANLPEGDDWLYELKLDGSLYSRIARSAGRVLARDPVLMHLGPLPESISLAPGQELEGDFDLNHLPGGPYPRNENLLLLWSHGLAIAGRTDGVRITGITLLPKRTH
jgi:hypothetical protein